MRTSIATVVMLGWLGQAMAANSTTDFTFALECRSATSQTNKWGYTAETNCNPPMVQSLQAKRDLGPNHTVASIWCQQVRFAVLHWQLCGSYIRRAYS